MKRNARTILMLTVVVVCWLGAQALNRVALEERSTWPKTEDYALFLPPPNVAPFIYAGFREVAADITWVRALVYYGTSMVGEADYRYLELFIDNVIALDPQFERAYSWAIHAVTYRHAKATQEEFQASLAYAQRGIEQFPDNYLFFYEAGILCTYDIYSDDSEELERYRQLGADYIDQASRRKNAPSNLASLAASLRTKLGQKERALQNLREMILITENKAAQEILIQRYTQIAQQDFPDEARRAKEQLDEAWKREVPYAGPSMYILLGNKPSPVIDFDQLATAQDLFGVNASETRVDATVDSKDVPGDANDSRAQ